MGGPTVDTALRYARRGWRVFPCQWRGARRKQPLTKRGFYDASSDPAQIREWWERSPHALIGSPTGRLTGFVVLDVDSKRAGATGFDTLAELGFAMLPETPMAHTASGGLHLYFEPPDRIEIRNTAGAYGAGIGPQLDWRGEGGSIILPSPDSGYVWDPHWNFETTILAPVPAVLLPRPADRPLSLQRMRPASGLSPYAEAALDNACRRIIAAPSGEQEITVNREAFAIGTLAGAGAIPLDFARKVLVWAARQIPNYDSRRPWRATEIDRKIERAFSDGLRHAPGASRA